MRRADFIVNSALYALSSCITVLGPLVLTLGIGEKILGSLHDAVF